MDRDNDMHIDEELDRISRRVDAIVDQKVFYQPTLFVVSMN